MRTRKGLEEFSRLNRVLERFGVHRHHQSGEALESWRADLAWAIASRLWRKVIDWTLDSEKQEQILGNDSPPLAELREANIVTSEMERVNDKDPVVYHLPVLDVDIPVMLVPSTNPGHWHIYFNVAVPQDVYWRMLTAMAEAGIVQEAWVDASIKRGYSAVRMPWIKKEEHQWP